jgi:hypothetical protein
LYKIRGFSDASFMEFQGGQGKARRKARRNRGPYKPEGVPP